MSLATLAKSAPSLLSVSVVPSSETAFLGQASVTSTEPTPSSNHMVLLWSATTSPSAETLPFVPLAASAEAASSFQSETTKTAFLGMPLASSAEATPLGPLASSVGTTPSGDLSSALQSPKNIVSEKGTALTNSKEAADSAKVANGMAKNAVSSVGSVEVANAWPKNVVSEEGTTLTNSKEGADSAKVANDIVKNAPKNAVSEDKTALTNSKKGANSAKVANGMAKNAISVVTDWKEDAASAEVANGTKGGVSAEGEMVADRSNTISLEEGVSSVKVANIWPKNAVSEEGTVLTDSKEGADSTKVVNEAANGAKGSVSAKREVVVDRSSTIPLEKGVGLVEVANAWPKNVVSEEGTMLIDGMGATSTSALLEKEGTVRVDSGTGSLGGLPQESLGTKEVISWPSGKTDANFLHDQRAAEVDKAMAKSHETAEDNEKK
ncbi:hypothetical protein TorRG33x02_098800 [Trema orientale]|uniref:Uncharacterized protein n=1 Tax=Trema orientale TaxID=63057 RepID=A0A2P5F9F6_TREOI|nr:hypothetical protein TorRG33x02_098800 [Trema orientale]